MRLVVDTNILFSFFWKNSLTKKLLQNKNLVLFSPEFALEELKKYESEIMFKTNLTKKEFNEIRKELVFLINFIPIDYYKNFFRTALKISPDRNDVDFFAVALKLKMPLWSNDLKLKKQNKVIVLDTRDIIEQKLSEKNI